MSNADGSQGAAKFVSIGGSRMEEVRTWNHAGEIFSRALDWSGNSFDVGDLSRLNSFQVTSTNKKTSKGSVTIPLHGAKFVDFQTETSNEFHLLVAHGQQNPKKISKQEERMQRCSKGRVSIKKKHIFFMEFSIMWGGIYPFSITFLVGKKHLPQKMLKSF